MPDSASSVQPGGKVTPAAGPVLRLQVLGPVRLWRDGVEQDTGPRQQARLLALFLARAGTPISTTELTDLIWDDDVPSSALNVIQKYVGALRRLLEPTVPARESGSFLLRRGNTYLFTAAPGMLDLIDFRELADAARAAVARQRHDEALDRYAEALSLWQGRSGDGLAHGSAAQPVFAALDNEFYAACTMAAELAVPLRSPARVLPALQLAASMAPFHEPVQAGLVAVLGAAGRQAEALSTFHAVRARLADELGIDPGPALQAAHRRVLTPALLEELTGDATHPPAGLIGRVEEFATLRRVVDGALAGRTGLGVVEGEPGVGKTRLLQEVAAEASRRGAFVVWGSCLEGDGTPSMWPWEQVLRPLLGSLPEPLREKSLSGELGGLLEPSGDAVVPDGGAQFRLFEQVVTVTGHASAQQPTLLIIDDLQWADAASLQLFGHLAARLPERAAIIGALRDRAPLPGSDLSRVLAVASRMPSHRRIRLGPLGLTDVAELIRRETSRSPSAEVTRSIHARAAGNPFFVQELSRLLGDGGPLDDHASVASAGVPATVRDVVRDRMADLDEYARDLLHMAALIGREADLTLLAATAGIGVAECLERLRPLQALGLLYIRPDDPFSVRFAHDLVRESVTETTPHQQAIRLHLCVADALEQIHADDESVAERLAYHLWAVGPLADPVRTAEALIRAGRRAAAKLAFAAAWRHLESAAQITRTAGLREVELSVLSLLTIVAIRRAGYSGPTFELLERGEYVARELGRETDAAILLWARVIGAHATLGPDRGTWARRLYERAEASTDPIVRLYGWQAWGLHQWDIGNIGEAYRYFSGQGRTGTTDPVPTLGNPSPHHGDLGEWMVQDEWAGWLAVIVALQGDVEAARSGLGRSYQSEGDPYAVSVWAYYQTMVASMAGDATWVMRAAERWTAAGADRTGDGREAYVRLDWLWARALIGDDPAGNAAQAEQLLSATLVDPPGWGLAYHHGLIAEMWLAAGRPDEAAAALDRAQQAMKSHNQHFAEGLLLLVHARLLHARGEPTDVVRMAAEKAHVRSGERGAHLFAGRAAEFLTGLDENVSFRGPRGDGLPSPP